MKDLKEQARQLRKKGFTVSRIIKELNLKITKSAVHRWVKGIILSKEQIDKNHLLRYTKPYIDIELTKEMCYLLGLAQTDGSLIKEKDSNKGKFSIELQQTDSELLYELQKIIPFYSSVIHRTRNTNFKQDYNSTTLSVFDIRFRTFLNENGILYGKKSYIIKPILNIPFEEDYVRGLIDGDGSLGITAENFPFISFCTMSEDMMNYIINWAARHTIIRNKPKRRPDNTFDFMFTKKNAQIIVNLLYYPDCLCLKRKYYKAQLIKDWIKN